MGMITRRNGKLAWETKAPRLDEMGESGVWLNIKITGPTDDDGNTPVVIECIEHASTGIQRTLNMPGRIECEGEVFYYISRIFKNGLTTYTRSPGDGEIVNHWELMAPDPRLQDFLNGCMLRTAAPIRAFTYDEIHG
jgi:hypothetical protein